MFLLVAAPPPLAQGYPAFEKRARELQVTGVLLSMKEYIANQHAEQTEMSGHHD